MKSKEFLNLGLGVRSALIGWVWGEGGKGGNLCECPGTCGIVNFEAAVWWDPGIVAPFSNSFSSLYLHL